MAKSTIPIHWYRQKCGGTKSLFWNNYNIDWNIACNVEWRTMNYDKDWNISNFFISIQSLISYYVSL